MIQPFYRPLHLLFGNFRQLHALVKPDPDRSGSATAVVVNGRAYLVDFGPGVVRRATAAKLDKGIAELDPVNITTVFLTHLHSDHTAG